MCWVISKFFNRIAFASFSFKQLELKEHLKCYSLATYHSL